MVFPVWLMNRLRKLSKLRSAEIGNKIAAPARKKTPEVLASWLNRHRF